MTADQHPRDPHDPSDARSAQNPAPGAPQRAERPTPAADERPRYGIRTDATGHAGAPRATSPGASARHEPSPARTASAHAARRMGRGLSFTLILLGLLVGLGLLASGLWVGWLAGAVIALAGVAGYALVQTRAFPVLRDSAEPPRRAWSRLWLIPAALLLLGLGCFATAFTVPSWLGGSVPPDLLDDYVLAFVVGGMTMVVGAGLGFGLVATARLTRPDDDDSPLRPTDYAERMRRRDRREPRDRYDSEWITHEPRD